MLRDANQHMFTTYDEQRDIPFAGSSMPTHVKQLLHEKQCK